MMAIYNDKGILIDELSDTDVDVKEYFGGPDQSYNYFSETFKTAKEYAVGLEQALDSIIQSLEDKDDIPII